MITTRSFLFGFIVCSLLVSASIAQPEAVLPDVKLTTVEGTLKGADLDLLKINDPSIFLREWAKKKDLEILKFSNVGGKLAFTGLDDLPLNVKVPAGISRILGQLPAIDFKPSADKKSNLWISSALGINSLRHLYLQFLIENAQGLPSRKIEGIEGSLSSSTQSSIKILLTDELLLTTAAKRAETNDPEELRKIEDLMQFLAVESLCLLALHRDQFQIPALEARQILFEHYKSVGMAPQESVNLDSEFHSLYKDIALAHSNSSMLLSIAKLDHRISDDKQLLKKIDQGLSTQQRTTDRISELSHRHEKWAKEVFLQDPEVLKITDEIARLKQILEKPLPKF